MKNRFHLLATAVVSLLCVSCTETQVSQSGSEKAVNPPIMGWSSWNAFRVDISEDIIKNQAKCNGSHSDTFDYNKQRLNLCVAKRMLFT